MDTISTCELKHYYGYGERLTTQDASPALGKGTEGHSFFEVFFKSLQESRNWAVAMSALESHIFGLGLTPRSMDTFVRIREFLEYKKAQILSWEIVGVEQDYRLDCGDFEYIFVVDLVIKENGALKIIDWKFTYDFYAQDAIDLSPQIPRYIGAMRAQGLKVTGGYYGFIRTRTLKAPGPDDKFRLQPNDPSDARIANSFYDLILSMKVIKQKHDQPIEQWHKDSRRASWHAICKNCPFDKLCVAELNGSDGKFLRIQEYKIREQSKLRTLNG